MTGDAYGAADRTRLRELALLFLRLGATAFGGPAAHVAMMRQELVRRRGWLSTEEFLDLLGVSNLIPGPNSTELVMHVGRARRGWPGLIVAGCGFILPAVLLTGGIAWAYVRYGALPQAGWLLYGIKPAVIAIVGHAIAGLCPRALRAGHLRVLALLTTAAVLAGVHELIVLLGGGAAAMAWTRRRARPRGGSAAGPLAAGLAVGVAPGALAAGITLAGLFGVFLKAGALLFGSGYVLLAFLRADLVQRLGWLTESQLIDAIAVGQLTPGPMFSTATFVGYVLRGWSGATAATVGIFLPAFLFVAASGPFVPRLRASRVAGAFLDGVNAASLSLMAVVTIALARAAFVDGVTIAFALVAATLLLRFRINSFWLVAGGAVAGWLLHLARLVPA